MIYFSPSKNKKWNYSYQPSGQGKCGRRKFGESGSSERDWIFNNNKHNFNNNKLHENQSLPYPSNFILMCSSTEKKGSTITKIQYFSHTTNTSYSKNCQKDKEQKTFLSGPLASYLGSMRESVITLILRDGSFPDKT